MALKSKNKEDKFKQKLLGFASVVLIKKNKKPILKNKKYRFCKNINYNAILQAVTACLRFAKRLLSINFGVEIDVLTKLDDEYMPF